MPAKISSFKRRLNIQFKFTVKTPQRNSRAETKLFNNDVGYVNSDVDSNNDVGYVDSDREVQ